MSEIAVDFEVQLEKQNKQLEANYDAKEQETINNDLMKVDFNSGEGNRVQLADLKLNEETLELII